MNDETAKTPPTAPHLPRWAQAKRAAVEWMPQRVVAADRFGINARDGLEDAEVLGAARIRTQQAAVSPKLDEFARVIDEILASDREWPKKQPYNPADIRATLQRARFTSKITM